MLRAQNNNQGDRTMLLCRLRAMRAAVLALLAALVCAAPVTHAADQPAMTQTTSRLTFVRLYSTPDGNSHFSDESVTLVKPEGAAAEGPLAVFRLGDIKGALFGSLKAGATEDWHVAPRRQFMLCLRGVVEVTAGDGEKRRLTPGQFVLLEDLTGKGHITHAAGTQDHVALAIPLADDVLPRK